jgi:hypothetical protein
MLYHCLGISSSFNKTFICSITSPPFDCSVVVDYLYIQTKKPWDFPMAFDDRSGVMGGSPLPTAHPVSEKEHRWADTFGLPPPR